MSKTSLKKQGLSTSSLKILAMITMLIDHSSYLLPEQIFLSLRCIGRLSFPIYAFLLVEGYFHTSNYTRYAVRLLIFSIVSEIPFDIYFSKQIFDLHNQNVMFTLFLGLLTIIYIDHRGKDPDGTLSVKGLCVMLCSALVAEVFRFDYGMLGIFTFLIFYFFRGHRWFIPVTTLYMAMLNGIFLSTSMPITVGRLNLSVRIQIFAVFSMIPIALYNQKQGITRKSFKYFNYGFYPAHLIILGLFRGLINGF